MRLNTGGTISQQAMNAKRPRQLRPLALASLFLLAACGRSETDISSDRTANEVNPAGFSAMRGGLSPIVASGSFSAVTADESRAADIGREVLQSGGNATDAVTAMYFALAVTLPSAAGLGASGACIVHDSKTRKEEAFVFPPVAAPGAVSGQPFTVPSGVRSITLMHVRHGSMRWEQTVGPAERLARLGVPVSRALYRDLQAAQGGLNDKEAQRIFGRIRGEGDLLTEQDLAGTLAQIRQRGGGEFFQGALSRTLSEQVAQIGGSLPADVLRAAVPLAGPPTSESYGFRRQVYVAPPPAAGALALAGWKGQEPGGPTPTDSGGFSGFAAVDGTGSAAACSLSMGQLFGARAVVPGMGLLLGAPTPDAGSVSPMIIASASNGEFSFVGAGGGGPRAAQAVGAVAFATIDKDQRLATVLANRRGQGGWVNAIVCPSGLRSSPAECRVANDPAGAGLGLIATVK